MARKKKYPKRPKMSSSKAVWDRYDKRCAEIKKFNDAIDREQGAKRKIADKYKR